MQIVFHGHACVAVEGSKNILIDPYITGNPFATVAPEDIKADYILVTHGHKDHLGNTAEIALHTGATIICVPEVAAYLRTQGCQNFHIMNIGGAYTMPDGVKFKMTHAVHSNSLPEQFPAGTACGFLFWLDDVCFYHAGDTGLFGDIGKIVGKHEIDVAFLPIGGNYTMGPIDAMTATGWLDPDLVIPIHYNTWEEITQNPEDFKSLVEGRTDSKCIILQPGQAYFLK